MKLSELINKFDKLDKEDVANGKQVLTPDQAFIFRDVFKRYNTKDRYGVLDAKSGSGKTTLIRVMIKYAQTNSIKIAVTASTGKAASALEGRTIHSYLGLKMVQNDDAETKDDALKLKIDTDSIEDSPDILIIDEASMIGQTLFTAIDKARFNFVLFVLDSSQLPPVKEKKVVWSTIADIQYNLTKTLRAKDPRMMKLFEDFREYKEGNIQNLNLFDYVNGDNIVAIDYEDMDYIPANSECCVVGYRNKLVEYICDTVTAPNHSLYNLNTGITVTRMSATSQSPESNGFYKRDFVQEIAYYNGEDVSIEKLDKETQQLVSKGWCIHNNRKLSLNKNKTGITISALLNTPVLYGASEPRDDKTYLGFPHNDIVSKCTLACIDNEEYVLLWDKSEEEYNQILDHFFKQLSPFLKFKRAIKSYRKNHNADINILPRYIQDALRSMSRPEFENWYAETEEGVRTKNAWKDFLSAKSVVSARYTTSRTIFKAQGISVPAVVITNDSFYGASLAAEYVAVTRGKQGLILVSNVPDKWKGKDEDEFE